MSLRASKIVIVAILLSCLLCPIVELFDHWDHTAQTGNDTEYTLMIIGLCVGVAHAFALVLTSRVVRSISEVMQTSATKTLAPVGRGSDFITPISLSPPVLALRI